MREHGKAFQTIREYFVSLGYNDTMFESDALLTNQFSNNSRVDFIVRRASKPYIVVEAKMAQSFKKIENENLKYDPSVRQVQTYAMHMNAPYYVVTNGEDFLWFETDDNGRPRTIEPVTFSHNSSGDVLDVNISEALNICCEFLRAEARTSDYFHELVLILLARFAVRNTVSVTNISRKINDILEENYPSNVKLFSRTNRKTLENCWFVLSECKPEKSDPIQLIDSLKNLAQKSKVYYTFRLNKKMSEFMLKLAMINDRKCILDPVANLGEITINLSLQGMKGKIYSFCQSEEHYAFLVLQSIILNADIRNTHLISANDFIIKSFGHKGEISPDLIITALPFGSRYNVTELRTNIALNYTNVEDYLIVASLEALKTNGRLVAIVPDSMLFAGGKRENLSELYNSGIVDVSHRFPKMYVIRPQFFIPMITVLTICRYITKQSVFAIFYQLENFVF